MIEANKSLFSSPSIWFHRGNDYSYIISNIFPIFLGFRLYIVCHRKFSFISRIRVSNYIRKQFIHRSICLRFINRWKLVISGRHRKEERKQGKRENGDSSLNGWMDNTRHVPRATSASFRAYAFIGAQRTATGLFLSFRLSEKETIPDKFITRHLATGNFGKG